MEKIDYKKRFKHLYGPSAKTVAVVDVPPMNFLMVDGQGDPNTAQSFGDAVEALFPVAYALKFMARSGPSGIDYTVMPLEALWWSEDMSAFATGKKDAWKWTLMVMQPEVVSRKMVDDAVQTVARKKNPVALPLVRFEAFEEGTSAQILHIGPFSEEGPTIEKVHGFIDAMGSRRVGKHHEIYLSDIRRAAPEKWKTIVRQPLA